MKSRPLWRIAVTTFPEAEDAVAALVEELFGEPPSIYTAASGAVSEVAIYNPRPIGASATQRRALACGLARIEAAGLRVGPGRISVRRLPAEAWATSWRRHFQPLAIGSALLVKPSWSKRSPQPGQAVVVLDPGLSFGTGQHPTTRFCLEQLVARRTTGRQSLLDLGTGSGILAIAAAKLGYAPVRALDFDPDALRVARTNARQNGVARRIRFERRDVAALALREPQQAEVICANLTSNVLLAARAQIVNRLTPGGVLVLAGILGSEFGEVRRAYSEAGLKLIASETVGEWRSGALAIAGRIRVPLSGHSGCGY